MKNLVIRAVDQKGEAAHKVEKISRVYSTLQIMYEDPWDFIRPLDFRPSFARR